MTAKAPPNSLHPKTIEDLREWLATNQARKTGIWLILWKKESGRARLAYDEIVEQAICFGWIDSKPNRLDQLRSMLWLAPRKPRTAWSQLNKARAENAIAEGRVTPAGLAKIEAAKTDGSWNALDEVEALILPTDLQNALRAFPEASSNFDAFPRSVKRSILEWIGNAKMPPTREKRVAETARMASFNQRANQWRQPKSTP